MSRDNEQRGFRRDAAAVDREIARIAEGRAPIIVGPWLAEVGYEVLYWIPFVRWFQDRFAIPRSRLIAVSRGGVRDWYDQIAAEYVEIFDLMTPEALAERNVRRRAQEEGGSQKQSVFGEVDSDLLARARARLGVAAANVCHPSLMFRLFRNVWHHNLPMDLLWRRTQFAAPPFAPTPLSEPLPQTYIAVKLYSGVAIPKTEQNTAALRALIMQAAAVAPVVLLDAELVHDEHGGFDIGDIPNVTRACGMMTPRSNLGVQSSLIARSSLFLGTCGGLAWMAPFLGVPTVAVYEDDRLLDVHLMVARQAGRRAGAVDFVTLDLRAWRYLNIANV